MGRDNIAPVITRGIRMDKKILLASGVLILSIVLLSALLLLSNSADKQEAEDSPKPTALPDEEGSGDEDIAEIFGGGDGAEPPQLPS